MRVARKLALVRRYHILFKENIDQETVLSTRFLEGSKYNLNLHKRVWLKRRGAFLGNGRKHLDRKIRHCYPRGPAWERIAALQSYHWCCSRQ